VAAAVVAYYVVEPFQPTAGDPGVTAAIADFGEALADGDGDAACEVLTEDVQDAVAAAGANCEAVFDAASENLSDSDRDELNDIAPEDVEVDGDRATATIPEVDGGGDSEVELVREDGDWKISDLGD
jgi:high-affinity K+ transport system ATPase subunit B